MYDITLGTGKVLKAHWVQEGIQRMENVDTGEKSVQWIMNINMGADCDKTEELYAMFNQPGALKPITVHNEYGQLVFGPSEYAELQYVQVMPDYNEVKNTIITSIRPADIPEL